MQSLVEALPEHVREQGAVSVARDRSDGTWRHLTWAELDSEVNRLCGALDLAPGERLEWDALPGTRRLAVDLALLHLGVVGVAGGAAIDAAAYDRFLATREDPGRLLRLRGEIRLRDVAAVRGTRTLDHAAIVALAERVAGALSAASPDPVLVTGDALVEQAVGWGALVGGYAVVPGGADLLSLVQPSAWVCSPASLVAAAPPPSRAGGLGRYVRSFGRTGEHLGDRLRRVLVTGPVPPEAARYRDRGVEVVAWVG